MIRNMSVSVVIVLLIISVLEYKFGNFLHITLKRSS